MSRKVILSVHKGTAFGKMGGTLKDMTPDDYIITSLS